MKLGVSLLVLALAAPACALAAGYRIDGKVIVDNPSIAFVLKDASKAKALDESVIRKIGPMIYRDNKLSDNETDLILELLQGTNKRLEVTTPAGDKFVLPPPTPKARALLKLSDPPDLNELWLQGPGPMRQLVDVMLLNPNVTPQIEKFVGQQLFLSWRTSGLVNNYQPLRDTIKMAVLHWTQTGNADVVKRGKQLLYDSMKNVDAANKGEIPDSIYADLKQN